jgi:putative membrane protein
MYKWVLAFHIIAVICWFAALFYLPRLFVYHAMSEDSISIERFKVMQRKLYRGIANPAMLATVILGLWLVSMAPAAYLSETWFPLHVSQPYEKLSGGSQRKNPRLLSGVQ